MPLDTLYMHETQKIVLNAIQGLVRDWHKVETIADFARLDVETTSDALCELQLRKEIEISEWEDGIWVCLAKKIKPLSESQKTILERYYHLVQDFVDTRKHERNPADLAGVLLFRLIQMLDKIEKLEESEPSRRLQGLIYNAFKLEWKTWCRKTCTLKGYDGSSDETPEIYPLDAFPDEPPIANHLPFDNIDQIDELSKFTDGMNQTELQSFWMFHAHGFTNQQISEILGRARYTVEEFNRSALQKIQTSLGLRGNKPVLKRVYLWDGNKEEKVHISARILIFTGSAIAWSKREKGKECPICKNGILPENEYCLYCDNWGMVPSFKTPKHPHAANGATYKTINRTEQTRNHKKKKKNQMRIAS